MGAVIVPGKTAPLALDAHGARLLLDLMRAAAPFADCPVPDAIPDDAYVLIGLERRTVGQLRELQRVVRLVREAAGGGP